MALRDGRSRNWPAMISSVTNSLNQDFQPRLGGLSAAQIYDAGFRGDDIVRKRLAKLGRSLNLPNNSEERDKLVQSFLEDSGNDNFAPNAYVYADFSVKGDLSKKESDLKVIYLLWFPAKI